MHLARLARHRRTFVASSMAFAIGTLALVAHAALTGAPGQTSAKFSASGPGGLSIVGKNTDSVAVAEEAGNVKVSVQLASLDTGIGLRNRHMKEKYLETGKYPLAVLVVPRASLKTPAAGQKVSGEASGTMTIHGKTQPVKLHYDAANEGGIYRIVGTTALDIRTFDINVPSYLGVTVKPNVDVEVHFSAKD